jgi:predicted HNH restriction endonuclease
MRGKIARNKAKDLEEKIVNIQSAIRGKIARNKAADVYIDASLKQQQQQAAAKIQAVQRGIKTRNKLNTNSDFQNKIDMQIKKYGDAASEYSTRGKDSRKVNEEFSNIMKTMRKGLQSYKTTLGVQPKKRGPKPRKPEQNEF